MRKLFLILISLSFGIAQSSDAPLDKSLLTQVENYLNGITELVAEFTQNTTTTGKIWLKRSIKEGGKMRLDYEPRLQQRVVARDDQLFVYDLTDKSDPLPQSLSGMPAAFILQNNISLEKDAAVKKISKRKDGKYLDLQLSSPADLTLTFSLYENGNIKDLDGWVLIDAQGQEIDVKLTKVNVNDPTLVSDSLFAAPFKDFIFYQ